MPRPPITTDFTSRTFGRLTPLRFYCTQGSAKRYWVCQCSCEPTKTVVVSANNLKTSAVRSCGCLRKESAVNAGKKRIKRKRINLREVARLNGVNVQTLHYHIKRGRKLKDALERIKPRNKLPPT